MSNIVSRLLEIAAYLFSTSGSWIWLVAAAALAILMFILPQPFWLTDLIYRFPLVGKLARYSHDFAEQVPGGWRNVELTLCRDYAPHTGSLSRSDFESHVEYLRKAQDLGRRPMPAWAVILISTLVVFEGLAFAYILGSWISVESSENERLVFMILIVLVLAIILVLITHAAGHQIFRTKLLRACFRAWKESRGPLFFSRVVSLADDQYVDDDQPSHVQCANRVVARFGDFGSYLWVWVAATFISVIAIGSTILRLKTLKTANDAQLLDNLFGGVGPAVANSAGPTDNTAAFVSFGILAVIFIVTQFVSMNFGYKYGFAGRQSTQAYIQTQGFSDYRAYWRGIQHRMNIANLRLQTLQRLLEEKAQPIDWKRNFFDFVREERMAGNHNLNEPPVPPDNPPSRPHEANAAEGNTEDEDNVTRIDRTTK